MNSIARFMICGYIPKERSGGSRKSPSSSSAVMDSGEDEDSSVSPPPSPQAGGSGSRTASPSRSSNSGAVAVNESLVSVMECPVCFDISIPILQCQNGHIICETCLASLAEKNCPSCRISCATTTRNLALEKVLKSCDLQLACKFTGNGCERRMPYYQKVAHQKICPFKSYPCPLAPSINCPWEGTVDQIVPHLTGRHRSGHSIPVVYGSGETLDFVTHAPVDSDPARFCIRIQILTCFEVTFIVVLNIKAGSNGNGCEYGMLVQCMGTNDIAQQFAYRTELERDGRRLSWEAVPLPISKSVRAAIEKGDCFSFGRKTVRHFSILNSDILPINVTITKRQI